jgi:hypothetical protein
MVTVLQQIKHSFSGSGIPFLGKKTTFIPQSPIPIHFPRNQIIESPLFEAYGRKVWRLITFLTYWSFQIVIKVISCFLSIFRKQEDPLTSNTKIKNKNLHLLFSLSFDFEKFRDKVLKIKDDKHNMLIFNNYNLDSYLKLKHHDLSILKNCKNDNERELKASIAMYQAIVDLYVKRFLMRHPDMNESCYLSSLRMIALVIAIKYSIDEAIWNADFRDFIPITIKTQNEMEMKFLEVICWNVSLRELFE